MAKDQVYKLVSGPEGDEVYGTAVVDEDAGMLTVSVPWGYRLSSQGNPLAASFSSRIITDEDGEPVTFRYITPSGESVTGHARIVLNAMLKTETTTEAQQAARDAKRARRLRQELADLESKLRK